MPTLADGEELDFLRRQVLTSRNVRGSRFVDFLLGGLNYQIEHHLFPSMPRPNLRRAQPLIRAFYQQHDTGYTRPPCSVPTPRRSATSTPSVPHCVPRRPPTSAAAATFAHVPLLAPIPQTLADTVGPRRLVIPPVGAGRDKNTSAGRRT
jgi:fatty acid desaturase